eukprot:m.78096 g.78096  ORF g.78096 m.78096 type:complete len:302 (+) comp19170_c0_seq2:542-1447(+)
MRVTGLDIDPRHATALLNAGLRDSQDLLLLSTPEVSRRASITATAARAAKGAAATVEYTSQAVTALDMLESPESGTHVLTTGCAILDGILRGGIRARGITEIVGESASAKTQLCLQLAVTVQLPVEAGGLAGSAVFICTEDAFPNKRMAQLAETAHARWPEMGDTRVSDKVYVEHCGTVAGLLTLLTQRVPVMVRQGVRLVIIDSIAALFRGEYGRDDAIARADELFKICRTLKVLSDEWHTPVICVNQVTRLRILVASSSASSFDNQVPLRPERSLRSESSCVDGLTLSCCGSSAYHAGV